MVDCHLLRVAREMPVVVSFIASRSASDLDDKLVMVCTPASISDCDFFHPTPGMNVTGSFL